MMRTMRFFLVALLFAGGSLLSLPAFSASLKQEALDLQVDYHRELHRLPKTYTRRFRPAQAAMGRVLFSDPRLSENNRISCASCHDPDNQFRDRSLPWSTGARGEMKIQAPPFWGLHLRAVGEASGATGRDRYVSEDLFDILTNPASLGTDLGEMAEIVETDPEYRALYADAYPTEPEVAIRNIVAALEAYVIDEAAHPKPSRFDAWADGQANAMSRREILGYRVFVKHCASCHFGPYFNGRVANDNKSGRKYMAFRNIGLPGDFEGVMRWTDDIRDFKRTRTASVRELGCANGLFHNRQAETVLDAVEFYDNHKGNQDVYRSDLIPRIDFTGDEARLIAEFLVHALSTKGPNNCEREIFPRD